MRDLSNATGIGTDSDFLNGDLVDNQTQINEFINQDLIQFFQKLADLAGIAFNDLPDNEINDYQLIEALETVVRSYVASTTLKGTVEKATTGEAQTGTVDKFLDAALLQLVTATESRKGVAEIATIAERDALTDDERIITSLKLAGVSGGLLTTPPIEIGDWDMDTISSITVAHGLADFTKIREISCMIRTDDDTSRIDLESANQTTAAPRGAITSTNTTNVNLFRFTGGGFDSALFSATSFNRGWIVIRYLP